MKKSVTIWMFKNGVSGDLCPVDTIECLKLAGFDALEISFFQNGYISFDSKTEQLEEIKRLFKDSSLNLSSMSTLLFNDISLLSDNTEESNYSMSVITKMIEIAGYMEIPTVSFSFAKIPESVSYSDLYDQALDKISKLAQKGKELGVKLCIENIGKGLLLSPLELRNFLETLNHPMVGCCIDTGNATKSGYPNQWIELLDQYVFKVHITDTLLRRGMFLEFVNPGQGNIDWSRTTEALKRIRYDGYLTIEAFEHARETDFQRTVILGESLDRIFKE